MEDVYDLLVANKKDNESFSDELRRVLPKKKKKSLKDFFGILPRGMGKRMQKELQRCREEEIKMLKEQYK